MLKQDKDLTFEQYSNTLWKLGELLTEITTVVESKKTPSMKLLLDADEHLGMSIAMVSWRNDDHVEVKVTEIVEFWSEQRTKIQELFSTLYGSN